VALTITDLDQFKATRPVDPNYQSDTRRFYSPWDDVHSVIVAVLGEVRTSFVLSMYGFDDDDAAALIDGFLKNPDVYAQLTLDSSQAGGVHERALLAKYHNEFTGNSVAIGRSEKGAIIHRKMLIVNGVWLVTGSTNWSMSGEQKQDNELTVTNNALACAEARHILDLAHTKVLKDMAAKAAKS
jgi:phosphatidylserine/phosphatidylglycerophosphate/cardiolipin synthase-like enzyme